MGCGASIFRGGLFASSQPLLRAEANAPSTPPGSRSGSTGGLIKPGLRIDTALMSREKAGLAETPIGKAADEFKYYCPICMMFFRSILELPCCKQSTCVFCFSEYIEKQTAASKGSGPQQQQQQQHQRQHRMSLLAGVPCPQCTVTHKRSRELRVVEGHEEAAVRYIDSPQTRAQMEKLAKAQHSKSSGSGKGGSGGDRVVNSPLKVGDDFSAMARKMLPFKEMSLEEGEGERGEGDDAGEAEGRGCRAVLWKRRNAAPQAGPPPPQQQAAPPPSRHRLRRSAATAR